MIAGEGRRAGRAATALPPGAPHRSRGRARAPEGRSDDAHARGRRIRHPAVDHTRATPTGRCRATTPPSFSGCPEMPKRLASSAATSRRGTPRKSRPTSMGHIGGLRGHPLRAVALEPRAQTLRFLAQLRSDRRGARVEQVLGVARRCCRVGGAHRAKLFELREERERGARRAPNPGRVRESSSTSKRLLARVSDHAHSARQ